MTNNKNYNKQTNYQIMITTKFLLISTIVFLINLPSMITFIPIRNYIKHSEWLQRNTANILQSYQDKASQKELNSGFDSEFADSMSKPLPDWYIKENIKKEEYMKEVEENRRRIMEEYKAKYDLSREQKALEISKKWSNIEEKSKLKQAKKLEQNNKWYNNIFKKNVVDENTSTTNSNTVTTTSTKEAWEKIWDGNNDDKDTEFYLPGFFEVFPELKLKWPKFSKNRNGKQIKCEYDEDCPFPQTCCPHPIFLNEKFCCTGFGKRALIPQYCPQEIISEQRTNGEKNGNKNKKMN